MLLKDKTAIIHGGGGAIGGAVARVFAREGATVFLAGRTLSKLEAVAKDIRVNGGRAEVAHVDALNEQAVRQHTDMVAAKAGRIDVTFNAIGIDHVQGPGFLEQTLEEYFHPIEGYL